MNQNQQDEQYLKLLSIFHYVVGGLAGLFACFPIFHFIMGAFAVAASLSQPRETGPLALVGVFFMVIAGAIILIGWVFAGCVIAAGVFLIQKKRYLFCMVMAAVECMFTPFGTVLGVLTLIMLTRPAIKEKFLLRPIDI